MNFSDYIRFKNSVALAGPLFHGCSCTESSGGGGGGSGAGATGPTGPAGPAGSAGATGPTGPAGGADSYWTQGPTGTISYSGNVDISQNLTVDGRFYVDLSATDASGVSNGTNLLFYNPSNNQIRYDPVSYLGVPFTFASSLAAGFTINQNFGASFIDSSILIFPYDTNLYQDITFNFSLTGTMASDLSGLRIGVGIQNENTGYGSPFLITGWRWGFENILSGPSFDISFNGFGGPYGFSTTINDYFSGLNVGGPPGTPGGARLWKGARIRVIGFIQGRRGAAASVINGGRFVWSMMPAA